MASPATAPRPGTIDDAREKVRSSNFFALCYLMLCQLSYVGEDNGPKAVKQIKDDLPKMPVPQGTVQGQWRIGWGPVVSDNNSNLMYAAEFVDTQSGTPVFTAVVIRGTDLEAKPVGVLKQIVEDIDAADQVGLPFANNNPNAKIAEGTSIGFGTLNKFVDSGKTVEQYLTEFVRTNPAAPIVVTGHSLGGCQTTVMALNLALKFANTTVVPNTFAAPTAGNSAFIELYEQRCKFSPRWFNTLDLVPRAFADLDGIKQLWNVCHRPAPLLVKILVEGLKILLDAKGAKYAQESSSESRSLDGVCQPPGTDPVPAGVQNETTLAIHQLIRDHIAKLQSDGRLPDAVRNLEGDLRNSRFLGEIAHLLHADKLVALAIQKLSLIESLSLRDLDGWVKELLFQHFILTGYWSLVQHFPDVAFIRNPFEKAAAAAGGNP